MFKEHTDLVLVSDLHIRMPGEDRERLLTNLIDEAGRASVKHFVLLGDVFDFCFPRHSYHRRRFAAVGAALSRLAAGGTKVFYFEGNHEFDLRRLGWTGVTVVDEVDLVLEVAVLGRIILSHGDRVYASEGYLRYLKFVKSPSTKLLAGWLPPPLLNAYALEQAKMSRRSDQYRQLDHKQLLATMATWMSDYKLGIVGHFHVPYYERVGHRDQHLASVSCWDHPNFLCICDGVVQRGEYTNGSWTIQPAAETHYGDR